MISAIIIISIIIVTISVITIIVISVIIIMIFMIYIISYLLARAQNNTMKFRKSTVHIYICK